jgi:DNA modification methylase
MGKMVNKPIDVILTSPPYNMTKRKGGYADKQMRYDTYNDWKSEGEYIEWSLNIFNSFDKVLKPNGVVIYNFSYSIETPSLPYLLVSSIVENTNFMVADTIIWKKSNSIPHPASYNRLNRIVEFIYIFCRKDELKTFNCHKKVVKTSPKGQKNNDGSNNLNKATYSTELCEKLLSIYSTEGNLVYDPFMGTGTTALACKNLNMNYIGSEISLEQVKYSEERLNKIK